MKSQKLLTLAIAVTGLIVYHSAQCRESEAKHQETLARNEWLREQTTGVKTPHGGHGAMHHHPEHPIVRYRYQDKERILDELDVFNPTTRAWNVFAANGRMSPQEVFIKQQKYMQKQNPAEIKPHPKNGPHLHHVCYRFVKGKQMPDFLDVYENNMWREYVRTK